MKTVVLTGAAQGIGAATAKRLRDSGWRVIGVDLAVPPGCDLAFKLDVTDEAGVVRFFGELAPQVNALQGLVNCAAVQCCSPIERMPVDDWNRTLAANLTGPMLMLREAIPLLRKAERSSVVNVSSVHHLASSKEMSAYAASKSGLVALTKVAALELGRDGIRVNALLPGATDTQMLRAGLGARDQLGEERGLAALAAKHPGGRLASPDEIAASISFLLDDPGSSFMSGSAMLVDGGVSAALSTEVDLA